MVTYCKNQTQADAEIDEWLKSAPGKSLPNEYGNQCTAAMQWYSNALFGRPYPETLRYGNAIDHIDKANPKYFEIIWNDPKRADLLPRRGDVTCYTGAAPLWDGRYYGHTGAVSIPTPAGQVQVQQDGAASPSKVFPDGNRYSIKPVHTDRFGYMGDARVGNIRGWLRPRWSKVVYSGADRRGFGAKGPVPGVSPSPARTVRHGIDVSAYQPPNINQLVAADFVIVKVTEGIGWTSDRWVQQLREAKAKGRKIGVYHFAHPEANGSDGEADYFVKAVKAAGMATSDLSWWLDWEVEGTFHYTRWAEDFMGRVDKLTGHTCGLYTHTVGLTSGAWSAKAKGRPVWRAYPCLKGTAYATSFNMPDLPAGWSRHVLDQYSFHGRLPGYGADLDLNVYYGGLPEWAPALSAAATVVAVSDDLIERIFNVKRGSKEYQQACEDIAFAVWSYRNSKVEKKDDAYAVLRRTPVRVLTQQVKRLGGPKGTSTLAGPIAYDKANWDDLRASHAAIKAQLAELSNAVTALTPDATDSEEDAK